MKIICPICHNEEIKNMEFKLLPGGDLEVSCNQVLQAEYIVSGQKRNGDECCGTMWLESAIMIGKFEYKGAVIKWDEDNEMWELWMSREAFEENDYAEWQDDLQGCMNWIDGERPGLMPILDECEEDEDEV